MDRGSEMISLLMCNKITIISITMLTRGPMMFPIANYRVTLTKFPEVYPLRDSHERKFVTCERDK